MHSRPVARLFALQRHLTRPARISSLRTQIRMSSQEHTPAAGPDLSTKPPIQSEPKFNFPVSEIPKNPLGEGKYIKSAACLIIGYVSVYLVSHDANRLTNNAFNGLNNILYYL